jgi:glycosyltransferase involved in cell wall biosynthesis
VRLAFVDTTLTTPPTGGCQTFLAHLAPALRDRGHDVTVITEPGDDGRVADQIRGAGVRVLDDVWPATDIPEDRARRLAEWANRASLDAYVVSVSRDVGWLALPSLRPETRTAAVIHSDGPAFYDPLAHYEPFVDCAIGVSGEIHQKLASRCRMPPERTRQIPYGVDRFSRPQLRARVDEPCDPAGLQVAYVGRMAHSQKRVLDLPRLVSELTGRGVPFVLHMIGDGPDAPRLAEAFRETKGGEQVRWWGWLAPAEVRARLVRLDALVLVSDVEGLPLALLEAMGHGVVPVVTRIPSGNSEIVRDGENGFLAPVGDMAAFAARLAEMHGDPALLARLRRAAWETTEGYSIERMASAYEVGLGGPAPRAPRPAGPFPIMPSCRSRHPTWLRRIKWRLAGAAAMARRRLSGAGRTRA